MIFYNLKNRPNETNNKSNL